MSFDGFGDDEPEDAWDVDDSIDEQLANLVRRARLLIATYSALAVLDALADVVRVARDDGVTGRDRLRADQLADDIAYVRDRL